MISPSKENQNDVYVELYKYLLSEQVLKVEVIIESQQFAPGNVKTTSGLGSSSESFIAFGAQSLAGASFSIAHPLLSFTTESNFTIKWAERIATDFVILMTLKDDEPITAKTPSKKGEKGQKKTEIILFKNLKSSEVHFNLKDKIVDDSGKIPVIMVTESVSISAKLSEIIFEKSITVREDIHTNNDTRWWRDDDRKHQMQKERRGKGTKNNSNSQPHNTNLQSSNVIAHLHALGLNLLSKHNALTFLPDYNINQFKSYSGDLCLGLSNIKPGQSVSLLFNIAEETASQAEVQPKISWFSLSYNKYLKIEASKIVDTTSDLQQSGLVQLTLPQDATDNNNIIEGDNLFWIIARCDGDYYKVANIVKIETNGIEVIRVLDENNLEAKVSVAPNTIENIFPKTANIKNISQDIPSRNGRKIESDTHFLWRSSQRLRHKNRAINQWDFEQLILEQFSEIFKVKCLNHAIYCDVSNKIKVMPRHTLIVISPHYKLNVNSTNFQPSVPVKVISEIENYLVASTSPFNNITILNTLWDIIKIQVDIKLNATHTDIIYYQKQLDIDLKAFISPWAVEENQQITDLNILYTASIVNFIDELPYVHHLTDLRVFRNGIEKFDKIIPSSEIHQFTSSSKHQINII